MTSVATVIDQAQRLVTPTSAEEKRVNRVAEGILKRVAEASESHGEIRGVILGGSLAKGTWLPGVVDIDVFVKLSDSTDEKTFERVGLSVGREAVRGHKFGKKYAQHPYTEATIDGIKVNIVPCYDVRPGEWRSAADRSQYHVTLVKEKFDPEAKTQARLLKRFMKSVGVYGAEIQMEGFSGYAAEVLILGQETFEGVLRMFASLKTPEGRGFSLLDPVDSNRDLARAISKESVARMVLASRAFLERPSVQFFKEARGVPRPQLAKHVRAVVFEHEELSEDTLWGELKRSTKRLVNHVEESGFKVARSAPASDNLHSSAILLLPEVDMLPELQERSGPDVEMAKEAKRFVLKNRGSAKLIWVGTDGRLRLLHERQFTDLDELLTELVGSGLDGLGASAEVARAVGRTGRLLRGDGLVKEASKRRWLGGCLATLTSDSIGVPP